MIDDRDRATGRERQEGASDRRARAIMSLDIPTGIYTQQREIGRMNSTRNLRS